ncbi:MAG: SUMF1/EgtB/PvdO family nonheme iron enzyme, partial [Gemmataceae bacterium]
QRSSQLFRLPADPKTPVVPRPLPSNSRTPRGVWVVAFVALLVGGWLLYRFFNPPLGPLPEQFVDRFGQKFLRMEEGTFAMGSPDGEVDRHADESITGPVTIRGSWYVMTTEVTHGTFMSVMGRSPSVHARAMNSKVASHMPVDSVTWDEAVEFCKRLTELEKQRRPGWGYRLPTEAEWEFTCRAGSIAPWSLADPAAPGIGAVHRPNPSTNPFQETPKPPDYPARVGQSMANNWGLHDCHGNIAEWCQDFYQRTYPAGARTNPTGPTNGDLRVVRGGSYQDPLSRCRSAARRGLSPDTRDAGIGFRVVYAKLSD